MLIALIALCWSCDDDKGLTDVIIEDPEIYRIFVVENGTDDKPVVIFEEDPINGTPATVEVTLEPNQRDTIKVQSTVGYSATPLEDDYTDENFPLFAYGDRVNGIIGFLYSITVDDKKVSDEIWLRKNWSYESNNYLRTYTLTVTNELLDALPPEEEE